MENLTDMAAEMIHGKRIYAPYCPSKKELPFSAENETERVMNAAIWGGEITKNLHKSEETTSLLFQSHRVRTPAGERVPKWVCVHKSASLAR